MAAGIGGDLDFFEQLAVEADETHITAFVSDVDSGHAADFAAVLHALSLGFQLLLEWRLRFACSRLGSGLLRFGLLRFAILASLV